MAAARPRRCVEGVIGYAGPMQESHVLRELLDFLEAREGTPDRTFAFEDGPVGAPSRIDVLVWDAASADDVTVLQTVGMCALQMSGGERSELRWVVRGFVAVEDAHAHATFLANVALYPFLNSTSFRAWEKLRASPPGFPGCTRVLFHPRFTPQGIDEVALASGPVTILHVVPITTEEAELSPRAWIDHVAARDIDVFERR